MVITGCAGMNTGTHWENSDKSISNDAQLSKDWANCNIAASQQTFGKTFYNAQDFHRDCLYSKGWREFQNRKLETDKDKKDDLQRKQLECVAKNFKNCD